MQIDPTFCLLLGSMPAPFSPSQAHRHSVARNCLGIYIGVFLD
jgi:hypothetical protein